MSTQSDNGQSTTDAAFAYAASLPEFGYSDIQRQMGLSIDWVRKMVRGWKTRGLLDEVRSGHRIRTIWKVRPQHRLALAAKARSPEQNMWTAIRQMKSFSPRELAGHATTEETEVTLEAAQDYCRALLGAGYLTVARKAVPGKALAIYRLAKNTGPRAPREKRVRALVDANTEQTILIGGGA